MTEQQEIKIQTRAEFLAHVLALKLESEERLQSLADCLSEHNNPVAAGLFQELADVVAQSITQLESMTAGLQLPAIPPWEYQWHCFDHPEVVCMEQAHYMMTGKQSLQLVQFNEHRSVEFLQRVYQEVENVEVKNLAQQLMKSEQEFEQYVLKKIENIEDDGLLRDDLDPPNMPE